MIELIIGVLAGGVAAVLFLLTRRKPAPMGHVVKPLPEPTTTSAQDNAHATEATQDAIKEAVEAKPKSNPATVSNLVGLADRERAK